jgi:hypothetical protein
VAISLYVLENTMADTGHLKTQAHELIKQHCEYDGSGRMVEVYTVRADAEDGTPCSVVRYAYDGLSSRVVYMEEDTAVWDSNWEVEF